MQSVDPLGSGAAFRVYAGQLPHRPRSHIPEVRDELRAQVSLDEQVPALDIAAAVIRRSRVGRSADGKRGVASGEVREDRRRNAVYQG